MLGDFNEFLPEEKGLFVWTQLTLSVWNIMSRGRGWGGWGCHRKAERKRKEKKNWWMWQNSGTRGLWTGSQPQALTEFTHYTCNRNTLSPKCLCSLHTDCLVSTAWSLSHLMNFCLRVVFLSIACVPPSLCMCEGVLKKRGEWRISPCPAAVT